MHLVLEGLEHQIDEAKYYEQRASQLHAPANGDKYTYIKIKTEMSSGKTNRKQNKNARNI